MNLPFAEVRYMVQVWRGAGNYQARGSQLAVPAAASRVVRCGNSDIFRPLSGWVTIKRILNPRYQSKKCLGVFSRVTPCSWETFRTPHRAAEDSEQGMSVEYRTIDETLEGPQGTNNSSKVEPPLFVRSSVYGNII